MAEAEAASAEVQTQRENAERLMRRAQEMLGERQNSKAAAAEPDGDDTTDRKGKGLLPWKGGKA